MKLDDRRRGFLARAIDTLEGTPRQKEVALAHAEAGSEKAGAARIGMKLPTAKGHMQKIYRKNGVDCLAHLVLSGCENLFIEMQDDTDLAPAAR